MQKLVELSDGDLRKSITRLQSLSLGRGSIKTNHVIESCGQIDDETISNFVDSCKNPKLAAVERQIKQVIYGGYSSAQFLRQLAPYIIGDSNLSGVQKAKILQIIAVSCFFIMPKILFYF